MFKKTLISLAVASSVGLTGCFDSAGSGSSNANPDYKISNPDFTGKTWPVLNGLTQEFPIPNDILTLLNPVSDGTMIDGSDPENPVATGIGFLDGNSTTAAFDIKLSGSIDPNQDLDARSFVILGESVLPNPDQNVFLLPLTFPGGDPLLQADGEVPSFKEAIDFQTGAALARSGDPDLAPQGAAILSSLAEPVARAEIISLDEGTNNYLRINPVKPLDPKTKYLVVITNDVKDASGEALVGSPAYQNYRDPDQPLGNPALAPFKSAVSNWEMLAEGYFGFMQTVYNQAEAPFQAPQKDDIVFTITFTTTGIEDVVTANAAPRKFFANSAIVSAKQEAIAKLNTGALNLTNQPVETEGADDPSQAINGRIFELLTDQTAGFQFYNAELASTLTDAEAAGIELTFTDVAVDSIGDVNSTLAFALQSAAAQASLDTVVAAGPTTIEDMILSQSTQVESAFVTSLEALESAASRPVTFFATGRAASDINDALAAPALVSEGEIELPYFLGVPADATDGDVITTGSWKSNQGDNLQDPPLQTLPEVVAPSDKVTYRFPFVEKTDDLTVPTLVTYPDEAFLNQLGISKPAEGWPVIISQHGITGDRSATLPLANALAFACVDASDPQQPVPSAELDCFATIAIDQPLHGVLPKGSSVPGLTPISVDSGASAAAIERHFNFTANAALEATPISALPEAAAQSGSLFINLSNFVNSRDNNRQGTLDLLNLNASISAMDIDGIDNGPDLDTSRVYFVGHSLGGINGIPFVSINNQIVGAGVNTDLPEIQAAAILNSGGGITKLLENSANTSFGAPAILAGLAQASDGVLVQGSSALESYFSVLQGLLDSTDPVNFGSSLADSDILLTEIVGDGTAENLPDQTIPNAADADLYDQGPLDLTLPNGFRIDSLPAPLAGTEPTIAQFGATATANGELPAITRFTEGSHATPVSGDNPAVFSEMVSQIAQLFSNGEITVTNPAIVEGTD